MSVINQMLKDLDKRQEENPAASHVSVPVSEAKNNTPLAVVVTVMITLVLVALAYLYIENQSLKNDTAQLPVNIETHEQSNRLPTEQSNKPKAAEKNTQLNVVEGSQNLHDATTEAERDIELNNAEKVTKSAPDKLAQLKLEQVKVVATAIENKALKIDNAQPAVAVLNEPKPTLNISRKKLSPQALSENKMQRAEQAVIDGDIPTAEQLFEDILLISPTHMAARKQLAALLYGRQSLQEAVNVLLNGIQLSPQEAELRIMLAKIYLEKGFQQQAFDLLSEVPELVNVEYLSLLATTAQSLKQYQQAKGAYLKLTQLQPRKGRWSLGLAIAHDSLGQYKEAYIAYNKAVQLGGLSVSAANFAEQRKLELGE